MKLILSSFGFIWSQYNRSIFFRMPPANLNIYEDGFIPDYAPLILSEKIIMDEVSFEKLIKEKNELFSTISQTMKILNSEGFIELVDYNSILKKKSRLINRMIEIDMKSIDYWISPLKESFMIWEKFITKLKKRNYSHQFSDNSKDYKIPREKIENLHNQIVNHNFHTYEKFYNTPLINLTSRLFRHAIFNNSIYNSELKKILEMYLTYINSNIILSNTLKSGFYDWSDIIPFYKHKFLSIGQEELKSESFIQKSNKIFEILFPKVRFENYRNLIKILHDRRIESLRKLVSDSVNGLTLFDEKFANHTIQDVFNLKKRDTNEFRQIQSYLFKNSRNSSNLTNAIEENIDAAYNNNDFYICGELNDNSTNTFYKSRRYISYCMNKYDNDLNGLPISDRNVKCDEDKKFSNDTFKIFLCHASDDKQMVKNLYKKLLSKNFKPWLDEINILPGQNWQLEIENAINDSDAILICLSKNSIKKNGFLQKEIMFALDKANEHSETSIFIIPVRLDNCEIPKKLSQWQYVDLFEKDGFDRLTNSLCCVSINKMTT